MSIYRSPHLPGLPDAVRACPNPPPCHPGAWQGFWQHQAGHAGSDGPIRGGVLPARPQGPIPPAGLGARRGFVFCPSLQGGRGAQPGPHVPHTCLRGTHSLRILPWPTSSGCVGGVTGRFRGVSGAFGADPCAVPWAVRAACRPVQ